MSGIEQQDVRPRRSFTQLLVNSAIVLVIVACAAWLAPSLLGFERYVITGGSMSGTFEKGSLALERQVPVEELAVGDVITYLPPAGSGTTDLVTHRIVSMKPGTDGTTVLRTKGDANPAVDPWTFQLDRPTQPVVVATVPYAGNAFIALADPHTRMAVVGGPAAVVALLALTELVGALRERRRDRVTKGTRVVIDGPAHAHA